MGVLRVFGIGEQLLRVGELAVLVELVAVFPVCRETVPFAAVTIGAGVEVLFERVGL